VSTAHPILEVQGLCKSFPVGENFLGKPTGWVQAVNNVSFSIANGETLGLVGESGCGKSTVSRLVLRLIEADRGTIRFDGHDMRAAGREALRQIRRNVQFIQQDPYSSLDPLMTIGDIIEESLIVHRIGRADERRAMVRDVLGKVGIRADMMDRTPHEFSGGQRQRICIARALVLEPKLIIADEPVSALDVSVQSQVLNLMLDLQEQMNLSFLFIAHDLTVVEHMSDRVAVMYLGQIVELASDTDIYSNPGHPYTRLLLAAAPRVDAGPAPRRRDHLQGEIPSPLDPPSGCPFHPRCPNKLPICEQIMPPLADSGNGHLVACHNSEGTGAPSKSHTRNPQPNQGELTS